MYCCIRGISVPALRSLLIRGTMKHFFDTLSMPPNTHTCSGTRPRSYLRLNLNPVTANTVKSPLGHLETKTVPLNTCWHGPVQTLYGGFMIPYFVKPVVDKADNFWWLRVTALEESAFQVRSRKITTLLPPLGSRYFRPSATIPRLPVSLHWGQSTLTGSTPWFLRKLSAALSSSW